MKPKPWNGEDLKGLWLATIKVDGIRCVIKDGVARSYSDKPLYGIPSTAKDGDYEVFCGSFEDTKKILTTRIPHREVTLEEMFRLDGVVPDERLILTVLVDPTAEQIQSLLSIVESQGHEGLVLRQEDAWIKVKKNETHDVEVLDLIEGKGQFVGMLGAVMTTMGKVGTGFSKEQRAYFWEHGISDVIEVECMELTKDGKFRHPRFKRERIDK